MGAQRTREDDGSLREGMDLLLRLNTREDPSIGRVYFTSGQKSVVEDLLSGYFGASREEDVNRQALAIPTDSRRLQLQVSRILTEVQERDQDAGFLSEEERRQIRRTLADLATHVRRIAFRLPRVRMSRGAWIATAIAVVVVGVGVPVASVVYGPGETPKHHAVVQAPPPANAQQNPGNNDRQNMEDQWGSWDTIAPSAQNPDTKQPAVLLLKDNGAEMASSKWSVPYQASNWGTQAASDISGLSVEGTSVRVVGSNDQEFRVHVNQAFIFEHNPGTVYRIDASGQVWTVDLATAATLRLPLTH